MENGIVTPLVVVHFIVGYSRRWNFSDVDPTPDVVEWMTMMQEKTGRKPQVRARLYHKKLEFGLVI